MSNGRPWNPKLSLKVSKNPLNKNNRRYFATQAFSKHIFKDLKKKRKRFILFIVAIYLLRGQKRTMDNLTSRLFKSTFLKAGFIVYNDTA